MANIFGEKINDLMECSICNELHVQAGMLPCGHIFCLNCLMIFGKDKMPGSHAECPKCRQVFVIPENGMHDLQRNFIITSHSTQCPKKILCEICEENKEDESEEISLGSEYCKQCSQYMCDTCSKHHRRQKLSKTHELVKIEDYTEEEASRVSAINDCIHDEREMTEFCIDCKKVMCISCALQNHETHQYGKINDLREKLIREIDVDLQNLQKNLEGHEEKRKLLNVKKNEMLETTASVHSSYETNVENEEKRSSLSEELATQKKVHLKEIENEKYEIELFMEKSDSFEIYYSTNKDNLSIIQVSQLKDTLIELKNFNENLLQKYKAEYASSEVRSLSSPQTNLSSENSFMHYKKGEISKELDASSSTEHQTDTAEATLDSRQSRKQRKTMYPIDETSPFSTMFAKDEDYRIIRRILEKPSIQEDDVENFMSLVLPYIIQRLKMWNGYVLYPQSIADLLQSSDKTISSEDAIDDPFEQSHAKSLLKRNSDHPVSRLDCIVYILNTADCFVRRDVLRLLSKFPMAIPFIIPDIYQHHQYLLTLPLLKNIVVKWESPRNEKSENGIIENALFSSPYKMVVALRLGTNRIGKSIILNQILQRQYTFSSGGEPGAKYGRPVTLDGTVEIVWLTQETCSDTTWNTIMTKYYNSSEKEIAILANLHGDALAHTDTLKFLKDFGCSFMVFVMPDATEEQWKELTSLHLDKNLSFLLVKNDGESHGNRISTSLLLDDKTLQVIRSVLDKCIKHPKPSFSTVVGKSLKYIDTFDAKISEGIADIVGKHGCIRVKKLLSTVVAHSDCTWTKDVVLRNLIENFLSLFTLPLTESKGSMIYLRQKLSRLSVESSVEARKEVAEAREHKRRIVKICNRDADSIESSEKEDEIKNEANKKLDEALEKLESLNLGIEHFYRVIGHVYEKNDLVKEVDKREDIEHLPYRYAELFLNGQEIELLDGDSGEIQIPWIEALFQSIFKFRPELRVFVISIIGLQSSGKSTLLNALFSCRFSVATGRCTRGLFMRIVFLDEELQKMYECDAIILIDTEGLSSSDKMNDSDGNRKDRMMATFAMAISDLTIVNILGEGMTEMVEILQIAIVTMARLNQNGVNPDMLVVQHLQERNSSSFEKAKDNFTKAIKEAFDLISARDLELGALCTECLNKLEQRVQEGELFHQFGPFKDGSSVNSPPSEGYHKDVVGLFEPLLSRMQGHLACLFHDWSKVVMAYWQDVEEEKFALSFKNIQHIEDFLKFENLLAKMKESLENAFRCHRKSCLDEIVNNKHSNIESQRELKNTKFELNEVIREKWLPQVKEQLDEIPYSCKCQICQEFIKKHTEILDQAKGTQWDADIKTEVSNMLSNLHEIALNEFKHSCNSYAMRYRCLAEFDQITSEDVKIKLKDRSNASLSEDERTTMVKEIWSHLMAKAREKEAASGSGDFRSQFMKALNKEFVETTILPNIRQEFDVEITVGHLQEIDAFESSTFDKYIRNRPGLGLQRPRVVREDKRLDETILRDALKHIKGSVEAMLGSLYSDSSRTGINFEDRMVRKLRTEFPSVIKTLETQFRKSMKDDFKLKLQIYALQQLKKQVEPLQLIWDKLNKPSQILLDKEIRYKGIIRSKISFYDNEDETLMLAENLFNVAQRKALKVLYEIKVKAFRSLLWNYDIGKLQLHYFTQLVEDVKRGIKINALSHFRNPEKSIKDWLKTEVDSSEFKAIDNEYHVHVKNELDKLMKDLVQCKDKNAIEKVIKQYLKATDELHYTKLSVKDERIPMFFETLNSDLERRLSEFRSVKKFESIFDDPRVKRKLDHVSTCFNCGALKLQGGLIFSVVRFFQWLFGIRPNSAMFHQPLGLKGIADGSSKELLTISCGEMSFFSLLRKQSIGIIKSWKISHGILFDNKLQHTAYEKLMRWFFKELHHDIATEYDVRPANDTDLEIGGFNVLDVDEILKELASN